MGKDNKNGILCLFALACATMLIATSLIVVTGNNNDSGVYITNDVQNIQTDAVSCANSYELDDCMQIDDNGFIVAVYDEDYYFEGEKEMLGEITPSNGTVKVGGLTYETHSGNTLWVTDYEGSYRNIVVPDTIMIFGEIWTVTKIADWGLSTHSLTGRHPISISLGPLIEEIGTKAFTESTRFFEKEGILTNFEIRDIENSKLRSIGNEAFYDAKGLKYIELPKSLTSIGKNAFFRCGLETVVLHSTVLNLAAEAFWSCTHLANINLENVVWIGNYAFYMCSSLKNVDLSSATHIGKGAFEMTNLDQVKFSNDLDTLEDDAFQDYCFSDCENNALGHNIYNFAGKTFKKDVDN